VSISELKRDISDCAKEHDWIVAVHSQTRQEVVERVDNSYQRFFKLGAGFPKFTKRSTYKSFVLKQGVKFHESDNSKHGIVRLPKIGNVRFWRLLRVR
jgi:putative transposase